MFEAKKQCYPPQEILVQHYAPDYPDPSFFKDEIEATRQWATATTESVNDRLQRYLEYFTVPVSKLRVLVDAFEHELLLGLHMFKDSPSKWIPERCSFKMLDSCIKKTPTGTEKGIFYAMDFGGTNFRVVRAELLGNGESKISQYKQSLSQADACKTLPKGLLDKKATATQMFDFFAHCTNKHMEDQNDLRTERTEPLSTCFTFSFACAQHRINSATLIEWTKAFETGRETQDPVEGLDVVRLMDASYKRNKIPLRINGILNDTVGTLLSCCYEMKTKKAPPCLVGMIVGTGINACYYESQACHYGYIGNIINLECGNFNRELPFTNVDHELDFLELSNRGRQRLEKMIAGAYLGELCRRAVVKVLQKCAPEAAWKPYSLSSENVGAIVEDGSEHLAATSRTLQDAWNVTFDISFLNVIRKLCLTIVDRAAALTAVIICGTAKRTQHLQPAMGGLTVGIDGSLYKCVVFFRNRVRHHLNEILGESVANLIHLCQADDGSGKGAAVLAACLST